MTVKPAAHLLAGFEPLFLEHVVLDLPAVGAFDSADRDLDAAAANVFDAHLIELGRVLNPVAPHSLAFFESRHALIRQPLSDR